MNHKLFVDVFLASVAHQSLILEIIEDLLWTLVKIADHFLLFLSF